MSELVSRLSTEAKLMSDNYAKMHNISNDDAFDIIFSKLISNECIRSFYNKKSNEVSSKVEDLEAIDKAFNFARNEITNLFGN